MSTLKCKMCGGTLGYKEGITVVECEYCGSLNTLPNIGEEKRLQLFDRANRLRSNCDFDRAFGVYEAIVAEYPEEAEAYWGLVLCKYGIEYVDDPGTGKKVPTCHRSSFDSIFDDSNFDMVMEYCDSYSREVYRKEAKQIEEIRKGIVEISSSEEPYDVFICYKETDENGDRTIDSLIAQDIYDALTSKNYRVFFSRITLEDKLGQEYEPYIFAALNSAKVMLVVGTSYDNYNAVWVKNEWSRFLKLMETNKEKYLIPCFRDIDAYDMPKEFNKLQSQDMSKVGAIQDLVRGIQKIIGKKEIDQSPEIQLDNSTTNSAKISTLLKRGNMALEDGDWDRANEFFGQVLNIDAECAEAYLGLAMSDWCVDPDDFEFKVVSTDIVHSKIFMKAQKYAKGSLAEQINVWTAARNNKIEELSQQEKTKKQRIADIKKQIDDLDSDEEIYSPEQLSEIRVMEDELKNRKNQMDQKLSAYNYAKTESDKCNQDLKEKKAINKAIIDQWESEKRSILSRIKLKNDHLRTLGIFKKKEKESIADEIESLKSEKNKIDLSISNINNENADLEKHAKGIKLNVETEYKVYNESVSDYAEYQDKIKQFKNVIISQKRVSLLNELVKLIELGDIVRLGNWPNGGEKVEWIVLERKTNKVLLLSKDVIDFQKFNDNKDFTTWENCTLRKWLNSVFYIQAFDDYERKLILKTGFEKTKVEISGSGDPTCKRFHDRVFLLTESELNCYIIDRDEKSFKSVEYTHPIADIKVDRNCIDARGFCSWWLRSSRSNKALEFTPFYDLGISYHVEGTLKNGVRPAIWINMNNV